MVVWKIRNVPDATKSYQLNNSGQISDTLEVIGRGAGIVRMPIAENSYTGTFKREGII
jgi:hypothetical protein